MSTKTTVQFVDIESIQKRDIKGDFEKFYYYCHVNGKRYEESVYCHSENAFLGLLEVWQGLCKGTCKMYRYTYLGHHHPIALEDIPADKDFKLKVMLSDSRSVYRDSLYIS